MKMDTFPRLPMASRVVVTLLLLNAMPACLASPVATPVATSTENPKIGAEVVAVEIVLEELNPETSLGPVVMDEERATTEEVISEELTPGAIISGDLDSLESELQEASYFVQRMILEPRRARLLASAERDDDEEDEASDAGGNARIGEIGTIISVIKIATELGEAVLPVVIKEVESSAIGDLVIGVIGGVHDSSAAPSDKSSGTAVWPIPIKVARRAAKGFLKNHPINY